MAATLKSNLDSSGRRQRLLVGVVMLLLGGALAWWLATNDVAIWARVIVFGPLFIGGLGLFQGLGHT